MIDFSWEGVMPAITTPFQADGSVDHGFLGEHAAWMVDAGSTAIIPLGSLGEGATLDFQEKRQIMETLVQRLGHRVPIIPAISALATHQAVALARVAADVGCGGLMVLPPYVHKGSFEEVRRHFAAVFEATSLPCMLYNNPLAYGTDVLPEQVGALLARHGNLRALKDSGGDARRVTANFALFGDRLSLFVGLDDMLCEGVSAGARGWVAGLVNAFPAESVELFRRSRAGDRDGARRLYEWFLPLLRLDTVPEFVQLIKLVQELVGRGNQRVRAPRLPVDSESAQKVRRLVESALATRPHSP